MTAAAADTMGPLRGIRVLDMSQVVSGPLAAQLLAEQGADVVKVEPLHGDLLRLGQAEIVAPLHANNNRGKRSIADFISLHTPLTAKTHHLINEERLKLMKKGAFLVNTSEPSVVDMDALIEALRTKRIAGAGLDVFDTHPVTPDSPLLDLDNVVLTPHLGGATEETIERHSAMMADDILLFADGQRPRNLVNPEAWGRRG